MASCLATTSTAGYICLPHLPRIIVGALFCFLLLLLFFGPVLCCLFNFWWLNQRRKLERIFKQFYGHGEHNAMHRNLAAPTFTSHPTKTNKPARLCRAKFLKRQEKILKTDTHAIFFSNFFFFIFFSDKFMNICDYIRDRFQNNYHLNILIWKFGPILVMP